MPVPYLKKIHDETGKSMTELETSWKKAKHIVKKEYKKLADSDPKFYALVTVIFKNMESINESTESYIPIKEFNKYYTGSEVSEKEGGIVTVIKDPSRSDLLKVCKMTVPDPYGRGGTVGNTIYVWPGAILHNDMEKQLKLKFDSKMEFEYMPKKQSFSVSPSDGTGSDFYSWSLFMHNNPEVLKKLISIGFDEYIHAMDRYEGKPGIPLEDLIENPPEDDLIEDAPVMMTTGSIFTDASGNDTRYKTPVLATSARGGSYPAPKIKKPKGFSRMTPSLKSFAESFNKINN